MAGDGKPEKYSTRNCSGCVSLLNGYSRHKEDIMKRIVVITVLLGPLLLSIGFSGSVIEPPPRPGAADPQIREGADVELVGDLSGGMMAIGGETTGWKLRYQTPQGRGTIEVDISGLRGEPAQGSVRVTGKIIRREYIERGSMLILRATKIEKMDESLSTPPALPQPPPVVAQPVTVQRAMEVQNRHTDKLMKLPGVVGVGTGIGKLAPVVIKVMVQDAASARNPQIPKQLEGVLVEVEVTGVIRAY
jgi:hypothetical protein